MSTIRRRLDELELRSAPHHVLIRWLKASHKPDEEIIGIGGVKRLDGEALETFQVRALAQLRLERPRGPMVAFTTYRGEPD